MLRFPAEPVAIDSLESGAHDALIANLKATLSSVGAGCLAAPQLGVELQVLAFGQRVIEGLGSDSEAAIVINPMLEPEHGDLIYDWESCLSIPDLKGLVPRYPSVRLRGVDEEGALIDVLAKGRAARILQHAHDHLGGVVFLDRMRDLRSLAFADEWRRYLADSEPGERAPR